MYQLTLTYPKRKAIDWVGYRYGHGNNLRDILEEAESKVNPDYDCDRWEEPIDLMFNIPENLAWAINDIGEECEFRWDCFYKALADKLTDFCRQIV